MSATGFTVTQIGEMSFQDLKDSISLLGASSLGQAIDWLMTTGGDGDGPRQPFLRVKNDYNMTFQDPLKPAATAFKRIQCFAGDTFELQGMRSTPKNLIFLLEPGENVRRNLARHKVGPGLKTDFKTAEVTLSALKTDRFFATEFMEDTLYMHRQWVTKGLNTFKMYGDEMAGSW